MVESVENRVLITGAGGQLGTELAKLLPNAILTDVNELDITDEVAVKEFVKAHEIATIVNCAAYTAVDKCEDEETLAAKINIDGPRNLAKSGAKIVHISTDYVFDGCGHKPYQPEDEAHPISAYGRTKLAGEKEVLRYAEQAVIIRTAWLYSPYGNNFVKTMRRLGAERESINVVADQIGTPTYAADLAQAIVQILPQISSADKGVYHFTNEGVCSWYDFARKIMELSLLDCLVKPIASSEYPTKAIRPLYSVLDKSKIKAAFNIKIQHWEDGLKQCLKQL